MPLEIRGLHGLGERGNQEISRPVTGDFPAPRLWTGFGIVEVTQLLSPLRGSGGLVCAVCQGGSNLPVCKRSQEVQLGDQWEIGVSVCNKCFASKKYRNYVSCLGTT